MLLKGHVGDVLDVKFFPSGEVSGVSYTYIWLCHAVQLTPVHPAPYATSRFLSS